MKTNRPSTTRLALPLAAALAARIAASTAIAATYYWDANSTTAGFGTAAGTWGTEAFWTVTATGGSPHSAVTAPLATDVVNFGAASLNYGNGTVEIAAGGVTATSIVFGAGQTTALTVGSSGGGAITLGGSTRTIVMNTSDTNTASHSINAPIILTGATAVQVGETGVAEARTLNLGGVISGTGPVTFSYTGGSNGIGRIILNAANTYTGNTTISTTLTNANTELRLGVDNALPTTTILTIGGAAGTGTTPGRETDFNLNGKNQTLAGLTNTGGGSLRTQNVKNSTGTQSILTINDSGSRTFSGLIGNTGTNIAVVKQGAGVWTLSGANTYTGQTDVEGGTITVSNATALGSTAGDTVVSSGARVYTGTGSLSVAEPFQLTGAGIGGANGALHIGGSATGVAFTGAITLGGDATIQGDGGTSTTFSGGIDAGAYVLTFNGSGATTISTTGISGAGGSVVKNTGGSLIFNTANSYTGLTTVNGGGLRVQNAGALGGTSAGTVVNGGGTGSANNARVDLEGGVVVTGEALTINGVGNYTGALSSTTGANEWGGNVTIGSAGTRLGASAGATLTVSGVIDSGAANTGLVIRTTDLTGVVILSGANTYLGDTQVLIGKLQLAGDDNRLPVGTKLVFSSGGGNPEAEFDLNGRNQQVAGISLTGTAANNSVNNSSATLSTLTVNTAAGTPSTFGGILKGNLALTKTGDDSLTLSGANTYAGATSVTDGTLLVNGIHSGGGLITVSAGATLGGTGTMGNVKIEDGILAPGGATGAMTTENLELTGASEQKFELGAVWDGMTPAPPDGDFVSVLGNLTLAGKLTAAPIGTFPVTPGLGDKWLLLGYTGTRTGTVATLDTSSLAAPASGLSYALAYDDSAQKVFLTVVPEPAAAGLLVLGGLVLRGFARRRGARG